MYKNNDFPFEGILKNEIDRFSINRDFVKNPFNNEDVNILLEKNIYFKSSGNRSWEELKKLHLAPTFGFDNFSNNFFFDGGRYFLTRKVDEDVYNKLKLFASSTNKSYEFIAEYNEINDKLLNIKDNRNKIEYLNNYREDFIVAYGSENTSSSIMRKVDIIKCGFLQDHLFDKIWNYNNTHLQEWCFVKEIEDFILNIDYLLFELNLFTKGKSIINSKDISGRKKIMFLDKIARMEVNDWEEIGPTKQAKLFELLLSNKHSYILDVLKDINNSNKKVYEDYNEIDLLFTQLTN